MPKRTRDSGLRDLVMLDLAEMTDKLNEKYPAVSAIRLIRNAFADNAALSPETIKPILAAVEAAYERICEFHRVKHVAYCDEPEKSDVDSGDKV